MSIIKLVPRVADREMLISDLAAEFAHPSEEYRQPLISIGKPGTRTHLLVVWDQWRSLSQQERSEIIMDAWGQAQRDDPKVVMEVSAAMGLTQEEALGLGYQFEPA